ncbi:MAG TPA: hypothetical protein VGL91_04695 [Acidobacteriota bacterium]|jgi:hypothetical protein
MSNNFRCRSLAFFAFLAVSFLLAAKFWESKPYTEWNEKEAQQVLNSSPWGETHTIADTSQMFYQPTPRTAAPGDDRSINREVYRHFRIRWISAKPVRMAISRLTLLRAQKAGAASPEQEQDLKRFVESTFADHIVIGIDFETNEQKYKGELFSLFAAMAIGDLKNNTYLVRASDGAKNFVSEYYPPGNKGLGAQFVFPRNVNGEPFITQASGNVRLVANLRDQYSFTVVFKPKEMVFNGKLEY